jgi:hypothetical protein
VVGRLGAGADHRFVWIGLAFIAAAGCAPPPPEAPEGLEDTARYLMREFYCDDAMIGAGLTGLMDWYDSEGIDLDGESPTGEDNVTADFQLQPLLPEDLAVTQVSSSDRELSLATGVMAVSTLSCDWAGIEMIGGRPDQDVVFDGEWAHYAREFQTDRAAYDSATEARDFPSIDQAMDPSGEGYEPADTADSILWTSNPLGTSEFGVSFDYTLNVHFRHGLFLVQGEERYATVTLTWQPEPVQGANGSNQLHQNWGVDALVEGADGRVVRLVVVWSDIETAVSVEDIVVGLQVNRINRFSERMSAICDDPSILPPE